MKKVARLRIVQDDQFVPPGVKINPEQTVRTTGRIKKPKAVFDPSDNYMPRSQRLSTPQPVLLPKSPPAPSAAMTSTTKVTATSSVSPSTTCTRRERSLSTGSNTSNTSISQPTIDICIVCLKREPRRGGNYRNKLVSCTDCSKRVHKLCMSVDYYESAALRLNFKCENCRTCETCSNSATVGAVTCAKCCKTYHVGCHIPKISKVDSTDRNWKCSKCQPNENASNPLISNNKNASSFNNNSIMPVKIIRQIIGDNVKLTNPTQKTTQSELVVKAQPQLIAPNSVSQQNQRNTRPKLQGQLQSRNKISSEAATFTEASIKVNTLPRKHTESVSTSSSSCSNSSSSSDDSDDEDYKYVEKKKLKLKNEPNTNHNNVHSSDTSSDKKSKINNVPNKTVKDLPKREVVKSWSVEQVAAYIKNYFPNEAYVFKDQEIDGNALLLLKRSDVVQKLPLKLGPSLRLYNLILKLQVQTADDPTLGWDCSVNTLLHSTE